jgi:hypothetical protein
MVHLMKFLGVLILLSSRSPRALTRAPYPDTIAGTWVKCADFRVKMEENQNILV